MSPRNTAIPPKTSSAPGKGRALAHAAYVAILALLLSEAALRLLQYAPYRVTPFALTAEPGGYLQADSLLGLRLGEGTFSLLVNGGLRFAATHRQGARQTGPAPATGPRVDLYGCSYAYGYGLPDSATLGWRVQAARPDLAIRCRAVPGYGTVQGLLQLEAALAAGEPPALAVFCYAAFHDDRNALTPAYRKDLTLGWGDAPPPMAQAAFRYPYLQAVDTGFALAWCPWDQLYRHWPLRRHSALVNLLQTSWESWQPARNRKEALTLALFRHLQARCAAAGVPLLVAGLRRDPATTARLDQLARLGLATCDLSPGPDGPAFQNQPYDTHPNARAHAAFAQALLPVIGAILPPQSPHP